MADLSDYMETAVADWICGGATPTRPTTRYVALFSSATTDAGGGSELTGNGYARAVATFGAAASGVASNSGVVTFPTATGSAWLAATHFAVYDALSGGNQLFHKILNAPQTVGVGSTASFAAGTLTLTMA